MALGALNPRPCTPIFITWTCRGGGRCDPPRVSKLRVVEFSGKNGGLLSTSTRDWWCFFLVLGQYLTQLCEVKCQCFAKSTIFQIYISIFKNISRSELKLSSACSPFNSPQNKVSSLFMDGHPGREQRDPHRQTRLRVSWVNGHD